VNLILVAALLAAAPSYPWPHTEVRSLAEEIAPPSGFSRVPAALGSFAAWLRGLPTRPKQTPVRIYDGSLKGNQGAHQAVIDIDVGQRDHQQCADAVMRLRAEYLFAADRQEEICFRASNGTPLPWHTWKSGQRPRVNGKRIDWKPGAAAGADWTNFRKYLDFVFVCAGTWSLEKELTTVDDIKEIRAGDVFIQGGFPGHAVIVVDVAENREGERVFLLAQSYMPAQDIHILRNPGAESPWYPARKAARLQTPEWLFEPPRLKRFADGKGCN
jgi:hypothetical protein